MQTTEIKEHSASKCERSYEECDKVSPTPQTIERELKSLRRVVEHTPRVGIEQLRELSKEASQIESGDQMCLSMEYGPRDARKLFTFTASSRSPQVIEVIQTDQHILLNTRFTPSGGRYLGARCPMCTKFRDTLFINCSETRFLCRECSGDLIYQRQLWSRNERMLAYWKLQRAYKELSVIEARSSAPEARMSTKRKARSEELKHLIRHLELAYDAKCAEVLLRSYVHRSRSQNTQMKSDD